MDGENHGKPYVQMDDLGGFPIIFGNTHILGCFDQGWLGSMAGDQITRMKKSPTEFYWENPVIPSPLNQLPF